MPEPLVHQWFVELLRRFNFLFALFDEERCQAIESNEEGGNPFLDSQLILCATEFLSSHPNRAAQARAAGFDLLIVDEAHHLEWHPEAPGAAYLAVEDRARGYLHANCSICHRPDGPGQGPMDFRFQTAFEDMFVCDVEPSHGNFGNPDARILKPGEPGASVMSLRMHATGTDRMPPLGTKLVDPDGTDVIDAWISGVVSCPTGPDTDDDGLVAHPHHRGHACRSALEGLAVVRHDGRDEPGLLRIRKALGGQAGVAPPGCPPEECAAEPQRSGSNTKSELGVRS